MANPTSATLLFGCETREIVCVSEISAKLPVLLQKTILFCRGRLKLNSELNSADCPKTFGTYCTHNLGINRFCIEIVLGTLTPDLRL